MPDYVVTMKINATASERLVRADNQAAAIRHVVSETVTVKRAETDDVIRITGAGGKLETAEG